MKNERKVAKNYYQAIKEKRQKRSSERYSKFFKNEKIKKRNYANTKNKNKSETDRKREKNI